MKSLFYCLLVFTLAQAKAQTSGLELFTEEGENFTLMINGVRQNATPTTNVKVSNLSGDGVKVKVVFEKALPAMDKFVMLNPGEHSVFAIRKNKKGEYALRMVSTNAVASSPTLSEPKSQPSSPSQPNTGGSTVSTTSTTTQNAEGGSLSMTLNVGGVATSGSVSEVQPGISMTMTTGVPNQVTTSTTVTSSTTKTSSSFVDEKSESTDQPFSSSCSMSREDYNEVVNSVKSKSFADVKLTVLKQAIKNSCVDASQVKSLAGLLSFEEDKLDFAKFAYDYTSDKKNYYRVNDAFAYESTIDELNTFLESKR
jgi:hypothetical protein